MVHLNLCSKEPTLVSIQVWDLGFSLFLSLSLVVVEDRINVYSPQIREPMTDQSNDTTEVQLSELIAVTYRNMDEPKAAESSKSHPSMAGS